MRLPQGIGGGSPRGGRIVPKNQPFRVVPVRGGNLYGAVYSRECSRFFAAKSGGFATQGNGVRAGAPVPACLSDVSLSR